MTGFFGLQCRKIFFAKSINRCGKWLLGVLLVTQSFGGGMIGTPLAFALDLNIDEIRGKSSKDPVSVLQNRYFLKAWRPEIGVMAGAVLDEAYLDTTLLGIRAGMFVNEWLGFEIQYFNTFVSDSDDRKALNKRRYRPLESEDPAEIVTPDTEVNAIRGISEVTAVLAPFYGKLNLMNKLIVYTDIYMASGLSRVETDQGSKNAVILGVGERFYFGKSWSLRIDFKDRIFNEIRAGEKTLKHSYSVDVGASYFFR